LSKKYVPCISKYKAHILKFKAHIFHFLPGVFSGSAVGLYVFEWLFIREVAPGRCNTDIFVKKHMCGNSFRQKQAQPLCVAPYFLYL
jgi:hypothetical protein